MLGVGLAVTVAIFGALWPLPSTSFVRDVFIGHASEAKLKAGGLNFDPGNALFTFLITYMWALSTVGIVLKTLRVRKEMGRVREEIVPESLDFTKLEEVTVVHQKVMSHAELTDSILYTRIARVLAVFLNTQSFQRTVETAKEESSMDAAASDSSYRMNRLFIWALPVLGFIGTVYGVSLAVSNFAGFLQGAVTPEAIKVQVGLITTGLGVAFYTTLLGLIFATLAAFASLLMERSEEGMLEAIDEVAEDRIVLRMPSEIEEAKNAFPVEEMVTAIRQGIEGATSQQKFPIEELAQAIDAGFRRLPNPDRYEEVFSRAIAKAGDLINQKYDEFAQNYERRVGELGSQMGGKLEQVGNAFNSGTQRLVQQMNEQTQRLAQTLTDMEGRQSERADAIVEEMKRLAQQMPEEFRKAQERYLETQAKQEQKTADRFEELTEQITTMGKEQNEQFAEAHERYVDAIADLDKKEIARWEKMVSEFNSLAGRLAEQFKQAVASLDSATARYSERVQESAQALTEQLEKVQALGTEIDKVLRTTQSMEATLRQVGSSDEFRQTLSNLRTHLTASDELLKQLSKPRRVVFQEQRAEE
jgi:biopolymer transport protein ExbB/TolQ